MGWKDWKPKPVPGTFANPSFHNFVPPKGLGDWATACAWMVGAMHGFIGAWAATFGIPGLTVGQRILTGAGISAVQTLVAREVRSHSSLAGGASGLGVGSLLGGLYGAWSWRHMAWAEVGKALTGAGLPAAVEATHIPRGWATFVRWGGQAGGMY
jgi:hypothetical protein